MSKYIQSVCHNCDSIHYKPGGTVRVDKDGNCISCGRSVTDSSESITNFPFTGFHGETTKRWDTYFHKVCKAVASKSPCLSRQIGAILIRDKSIVSTGYNGPARGYPHCNPIRVIMPEVSTETETHWERACPRHAKGYKSGEGLHLCPAAHAEGNCIANAARNGVSTIDTTLYMNCILPCKDCAVLLVNAGVKGVVVDDTTPYHEMSIEILQKGNIKVREFRL